MTEIEKGIQRRSKPVRGPQLHQRAHPVVPELVGDTTQLPHLWMNVRTMTQEDRSGPMKLLTSHPRPSEQIQTTGPHLKRDPSPQAK